MEQFYLWLLLFVPLAVFFGGIAVILGRKRSKMVARVAAAVGGGHYRPEGASTLGDVAYDYKLVGGGKAPPQWRVSVAVASGARFQVKPKTVSSRIGHAIGFTEVRGASMQVLTGDAEFDGRFFLLCNSKDTGRRLFSSPRNRDAARRILDRGYLWLVYDGEALTTWVVVDDMEKFESGTITEIVPFLAELAAAIRRDAAPVPGPVPARIAWPPRIALAASVLLAIMAALAYAGFADYPVLDGGGLALASLVVSVPVAGLVALIVSRIRPVRLLGYSVGGLIALPLIGWWGSGWLNGYLDRGPPAVHVVRVVDKYTTGDRYPYTYYVTLASWRPDRQEVTLSDERLYGVVQSERSLVAVTTMPGFFGFEWIHSAVNRGLAPK